MPFFRWYRLSCRSTRTTVQFTSALGAKLRRSELSDWSDLNREKGDFEQRERQAGKKHVIDVNGIQLYNNKAKK